MGHDACDAFDRLETALHSVERIEENIRKEAEDGARRLAGARAKVGPAMDRAVELMLFNEVTRCQKSGSVYTLRANKFGRRWIEIAPADECPSVFDLKAPSEPKGPACEGLPAGGSTEEDDPIQQISGEWQPR